MEHPKVTTSAIVMDDDFPGTLDSMLLLLIFCKYSKKMFAELSRLGRVDECNSDSRRSTISSQATTSYDRLILSMSRP